MKQRIQPPQSMSSRIFETRDWRGTFCLPHVEKMMFSQELELKTAQLPQWKPHLTIDLNRLERVNE